MYISNLLIFVFLRKVWNTFMYFVEKFNNLSKIVYNDVGYYNIGFVRVISM